MTTPITQIPKPEAEQFKQGRKLFLVPNVFMPPQPPDDGRELLERYWSEVRDQIEGLERSLGKVTHVFHEALHVGGDEGISVLQQINPQGRSFIQAMCLSDAELQPTENLEALEESADWQRCLSIGLISNVVRSMAVEGYQQAINRRYEHIAGRIDEAIEGSQAGVLFIREDHKVQFPPDVQVFYVAPPALDAIKRWIDDMMRTPVSAPQDLADEPDSFEPAGAAPKDGEGELL